MEYAKGKEFIRDFALRTRRNYEQLKNGPYEVTQLINSMVGLLIIPEQKYYEQIVDSWLRDDLFNRVLSCKHHSSYSEPLSLQQVCRHLRNAVVHGQIDFCAKKPRTCETSMQISFVTFRDKRGDEEFNICIPIELLREFLLEFSDAIISLLPSALAQTPGRRPKKDQCQTPYCPADGDTK